VVASDWWKREESLLARGAVVYSRPCCPPRVWTAAT
jgi:hypothetical protein